MGNRIVLVAEVNTLSSNQVASARSAMLTYCTSIHVVPAVPYSGEETPLWRKLFDSRPDVVRATQNAALDIAVREVWSRGDFDAVIATECGFPGTATMAALAAGAHPLLVDSVELGVLRPRTSLLSSQGVREQLAWWKMRRHTRRQLSRAEMYSVGSIPEQATFRRIVGEQIPCWILPHVIDVSNSRPTGLAQREQLALIFSGAFSYSVNYEAVCWFAAHVFPRLRNRQQIVVRVTGDTASRDLDAIRATMPSVEFTGFVPDVHPLIARSCVSLAPILAGGSTRIKIVEAMALGTPVVSTSAGAEGLPAENGEHLLIADTPESFADAIDRLIEDATLWCRISECGRRFVEEQYSTDVMRAGYRAVLAELTATSPSQ